MFLVVHTVFEKCFFFCPFKLLLYASYLPSNGRVAHNFCSNNKFDSKFIEKIVTFIREFLKNGIMSYSYIVDSTNFSFLCKKLDACLLISFIMLTYYIILTLLFQYIIKNYFSNHNQE